MTMDHKQVTTFTTPLSRQDGQGISIVIDRQLHRILKETAVRQGTTVASLVRLAVAEKYAGDAA